MESILLIVYKKIVWKVKYTFGAKFKLDYELIWEQIGKREKKIQWKFNRKKVKKQQIYSDETNVKKKKKNTRNEFSVNLQNSTYRNWMQRLIE